jgi:hypothetical protein
LTSTVITPTSKAANKDSTNGSVPHKRETIENKLFYIQAPGSRMRDLIYDFDSDSLAGRDLTVLVNKLFTDYSIKELAYQQTPHSILWAIDDAGDLYSLTVLEEHKVLAWARHELGSHDSTAPDVLSIAVIPGENEDELWLAVDRGDLGVFIERMRPFEPTDGMHWYVDAALSYSGASTSTLTGLDHLDGEAVDYCREPSTAPYDNGGTVDSSSLALDQASTEVIVGLDYESLISTLPVDFQIQTGASMFRRKRLTSMHVRARDSVGGEYRVSPGKDTYYALLKSPYSNGTLLDKSDIINLKPYSPAGLPRNTFGTRAHIRQNNSLPFNLDAIGLEVSITP